MLRREACLELYASPQCTVQFSQRQLDTHSCLLSNRATCLLHATASRHPHRALVRDQEGTAEGSWELWQKSFPHWALGLRESRNWSLSLSSHTHSGTECKRETELWVSGGVRHGQAVPAESTLAPFHSSAAPAGHAVGLSSAGDFEGTIPYRLVWKTLASAEPSGRHSYCSSSLPRQLSD